MKKQYASRFSISELILELKTDIEYKVTKRFLPFCNMADHPEYSCSFCEVKKLHVPEGNEVVKGHGFSVVRDENGKEYRLFLLGQRKEPYAIGRYEWEKKQVFIEYVPEGKMYLRELADCFYYIVLEKLLQKEERFVFHASFVETLYGGILFAGVSGAGKSTQAELWGVHEQARLINGDRPILRWKDEKLYGYGSPYAGSSKCYVNDKSRVCAVVFVKQDKVNRIERVSNMESFKRIYTSLTVHGWNLEFSQDAAEFAEKMVKEIPVYELSCTATKDAVETLKEVLIKENSDDKEKEDERI